jgi:signal transduction histidine kinase
MLRKHTAKTLLITLGVSTSISSGTMLLSWLLLLLTNHNFSYLFALLAVVLSAWSGGIRTGVLTTFLTAFAIYYIFIPPLYSFFVIKPISFLELGIFIIVGIVTNIVLDKIRNTKDTQGYKKKEKEYLDQLLQLQRENSRFQKEVKARDEFLSIASHELKTPLSSMLLQIQNALHNIRNVSLANFSVEKLLKMLQSTEQQSKRLSKMINDLLNVSLITTGKFELETEKVDLSQLVKDVADRFADRAEREGSPINVKASEPVVGEWDKLRIDQAITNLISNAIKYGDEQPIDIHVSKLNDVAKVTVTDYGIGIPANHQVKIFERFERAVPNHSYKGLGVGLYITQHIVTTHHGRITLKSKPNSGSTFTIELPLKQPTIPQTAFS